MLRFNTLTPEVPRHGAVRRSALVTDYEEDEKTGGHHAGLTPAPHFTSILMAYMHGTGANWEHLVIYK